MARPRRHDELMATATVRVIASDWAELHEIAGDQRPEIIRQLIAWHLRRPGAKLPERPPARTPVGNHGGTPANHPPVTRTPA